MLKWITAGGLALCVATVAAGAGLRSQAARSAGRLPAASLAKLAPILLSPSARSGKRAYIVQFRSSIAGLTAVRRAGATTVRTYSQLSMAAVKAGPDALQALLAADAVTHVSADLGVKRSTEFAIPPISADVTRNNGVTGSGVGIAIVDSGIDAHVDLSQFGHGLGLQRIAAGYDFLQNRTILANNDLCGHGTMISGIAAGNASASTYQNPVIWNTRHFWGVAPQANLINVRILDNHGAGTVANAIAALNWCIANRQRYNIRVANLSLGHTPMESYRTDPLCQACEAAWNSGIVVVCAAGNRGRSNPADQYSATQYGSVNSPGNDPRVITVGATNDAGTVDRNDDWVATYSSRGPSAIDHIVKPDVVAPGNRIISLRHPGSELEAAAGATNLVPYSYYFNMDWDRNSRQYFVLSGTSMAAAFVSGAAAAMIGKDGSLSPDTVKLRLMVSARKVWRADGKTPDLFSRGAGLIDVNRAVNCPLVAHYPTASPWAEKLASGYKIHLLTTQTGDATEWSDPAVFNNPGVWANDGTWSDGTVTPTPTNPSAPPSQALWADDGTGDPTLTPTPTDPSSPPPPSQALWADDTTWAGTPVNSGADSGPTASPTTPPTQALWADDYYWYDGTSSGSYGSTSGSTSGTTSGTSGTTTTDPNTNPAITPWTMNPTPSPTPTPTPDPSQALWADIFRLCISGDQ